MKIKEEYKKFIKIESASPKFPDKKENIFNEIKTIISEAVTNAIIHGCQSDEAMDVYMNLSYDKDFVYIEVIDRGVGILDIELAKSSYN